jgi:hypothetical protein
MDGRKNTSQRGVSLSLGRLPKHAAEMNEALKKMGVTSAHIDPKTGYAHWEDKNGRNALLKISGAIDTQAGHGDWAGK